MADAVQIVGGSSATFVPASRASARRVELAAQAPAAVRDSVELSGTPAQPAQIDAERVNRVREELRDGTYLSPDKLDIAVERLAKDLGLF